MNDSIKVETAMAENGDMLIDFKLGPEEEASLEALYSLPQWATYRALLIKAKAEFFNGILPLEVPTKITKQVGMVAGLNFAINQLPLIVMQAQQRRQKVLDETAAKAKLKQNSKTKMFKEPPMPAPRKRPSSRSKLGAAKGKKKR